MAWFRRKAPSSEVRTGDAAVRRALLAVLGRDLQSAEQLLARAVRLDSQDTEAWLALASVYRQRGEVGRSIHVHQNLLMREDLDDAERLRVLTELAADHLPVLADLRRLPDDGAPASPGAALRVVDPGPADASSIVATLDWSADEGAPRPPRDHFHVYRGTAPGALLRVDGGEGLTDTVWSASGSKALSEFASSTLTVTVVV